MEKAILYSEIREKKALVEEPLTLSPTESLIRCLDVLDFNAALLKSNPHRSLKNEVPAIEWIELKFRK
jgi:hypothetical protein